MKFTLLRKSVPAWLLLVAIIGAAASISIYVATNLKTTASQPDFSLTANPNRETLLNGSDGPYWSTITVGAANNFTGIVSMAVSSPNGVNGRLIRVDAGSQIDVSQVLLGRDQSLNLTISAAIAGNYSLVVTGTSGKLSHSVTVNVIARGLALSTNPSPIKISPASSITVSMTLTSLNGLAGNFTTFFLKNTGFYWGVSGIPTSILIGPGGTTTFTITITTQSQFLGGSSTLNFYTPLGRAAFVLYVFAP